MLPNLQELLLTHNQLSSLPSESMEWSSSIVVLDLAHNKLTDLPKVQQAPGLRTLNLSNNKFTIIPACVYSFASLSLLDIRHNSISVVPDEIKGIVQQ